MLQVNYVIQGSMEPRCICKEWNVGVFEKMEPRCIRVILDYILTSASLNLNFGYIYGFFYKIVGFYESNVLRFFSNTVYN